VNQNPPKRIENKDETFKEGGFCFSLTLRTRLIAFYRDTYGHEVSLEEANNYLRSFAVVYDSLSITKACEGAGAKGEALAPADLILPHSCKTN
jgi:hypothetical protein